MEKKPRSVFAERLRYLRKAQKMTQGEIASTLRIDRTTYTKYETDKSCPDQKGLIMLAKAFDVSVDYLLGNTPLQVGVLRDDPGNVYCTDQEMQLLVLFRRLNAGQKDELIAQIAKDINERNTD